MARCPPGTRPWGWSVDTASRGVTVGRTYLYKHRCNRIAMKCIDVSEAEEVGGDFIYMKWIERNKKHRGARQVTNAFIRANAEKGLVCKSSLGPQFREGAAGGQPHLPLPRVLLPGSAGASARSGVCLQDGLYRRLSCVHARTSPVLG